MPRTARALTGGVCCHVLNRGNGRAMVFHNEADYGALAALIPRACERVAMRVIAWCLMPNHFHLVVWPHEDGDLARWMQWLMTSQVRRHHRRHDTSGHIWQGRFKCFPAQSDAHLWRVVRYVERNPLRAGLVARAEDWPWSSLGWERKDGPGVDFLHSGPCIRPPDWLQVVNAPETERELAALRRSVRRGTPFGNESWTRRTVRRLGLEATLRPRGRPRKARDDAEK